MCGRSEPLAFTCGYSVFVLHEPKVPAEAKKAYRQSWPPRNRAKACGAKRPHKLFFAGARLIKCFLRLKWIRSGA